MSESDRIERLHSVLERLEADLHTSSEAVAQRSRGVALLVRVLSLVMGSLALANLYFVNDLTQEVRVVIARMDEMTGHFGRVSQRMSDIRATAADMEGNVAMMPVVAAQMREIGGYLDGMRAGVDRMEASTAAIDGRLDRLNLDVADMSVRFRSLNRSVGAMGGDVEQMARPVP